MQTVAIVLAKRRRKFSGKRIPHIPYEYYIIIVLGQMEGFPGISDFLAAALVVPQQQSANEPTGGIRAGSLSLGWWFVVCGTLMRHPRKWLFVLPGATNRAMSALSGGFRVHNAACGMCDTYPTISRLMRACSARTRAAVG